MYLGSVVELAASDELYAKTLHPYSNTLHPYSKALLSAVPPTSPFEKKNQIKLHGEIPSPIGERKGCALASRCPHCTDRCREEIPVLKEQEPGHQVACFLYD